MIRGLGLLGAGMLLLVAVLGMRTAGLTGRQPTPKPATPVRVGEYLRAIQVYAQFIREEAQ